MGSSPQELTIKFFLCVVLIEILFLFQIEDVDVVDDVDDLLALFFTFVTLFKIFV